MTGTRRSGRVPLERALSKLGLASRSQAAALVGAGRVRVDGRIASDPRQPIVPERACIEIDGEVITRPSRVTVLLHKPRGVLTTRSDPDGRPTVYDFLSGLSTHVVPVGRLDFATSGLLLLTNDTRLADWVADPVHHVPRTYVVTVRGELDDDARSSLERGVTIGGEHLAARSVLVRKRSRRETHLVIELDEGRNREVRRLLLAIGHEVTRLKRIAFGGVALGNLRPGQWRVVSETELRAAFPGGPPPRHSSQHSAHRT